MLLTNAKTVEAISPAGAVGDGATVPPRCTVAAAMVACFLIRDPSRPTWSRHVSRLISATAILNRVATVLPDQSQHRGWAYRSAVRSRQRGLRAPAGPTLMLRC